MGKPEHPPDPERGRAAFNMVALHLAGYTYDQIELFHPADMTEDRLHDLLIKKLNRLLGEWAVKQRLKVEPTSKAEVISKEKVDRRRQ
jgi:hypothetical protein